MGKAYSSDLRERISAHVSSGHSRRGAPVRCKREMRGQACAACREDGDCNAGTTGAGKLAPHMAQLIRWVEAQPDISMPELAAKLAAETKVVAHPASLSRALLGAGFRYKKLLLASECGRDDVCEARRRWRLHRQPRLREQTHRLVFIGETATTTKMTRFRGRALHGQRLRARAPFGHWKTQTFIAGLRNDGMTAHIVTPGDGWRDGQTPSPGDQTPGWKPFRPHILLVFRNNDIQFETGYHWGLAMQVAKWGNSLAVRLPVSIIEALGLREGDDIEFHVADPHHMGVARKPSRDEMLKRLRAYRGRLPADFRFEREEANAR